MIYMLALHLLFYTANYIDSGQRRDLTASRVQMGTFTKSSQPLRITTLVIPLMEAFRQILRGSVEHVFRLRFHSAVLTVVCMSADVEPSKVHY
jgi:hypothetical protein